MLNVRDLVTLDDGKTYVVSGKTVYKEKTYYVLIDFDAKKNIKFVYEDKDELVFEEDQALIRKIMPLFIKSDLLILKEEQSN